MMYRRLMLLAAIVSCTVVVDMTARGGGGHGGGHGGHHGGGGRHGGGGHHGGGGRHGGYGHGGYGRGGWGRGGWGGYGGGYWGANGLWIPFAVGTAAAVGASVAGDDYDIVGYDEFGNPIYR